MNLYFYFPHLFSDFGEAQCSKPANNAVEHVWVMWRPVYGEPYFSFGHAWSYICVYHDEVWHSRSKDCLGIVCVVEVDHWPPSSNMVKNEWSYSSTNLCAFIACTGQLYLYLILKRGMHVHNSCLSFMCMCTVTLTITFPAACECQAVYTGDICFLPNFIIEDVPSCFKMLNQLREKVFTLEQEHRSYLRLLARETKYGSK